MFLVVGFCYFWGGFFWGGLFLWVVVSAKQFMTCLWHDDWTLNRQVEIIHKGCCCDRKNYVTEMYLYFYFIKCICICIWYWQTVHICICICKCCHEEYLYLYLYLISVFDPSPEDSWCNPTIFPGNYIWLVWKDAKCSI